MCRTEPRLTTHTSLHNDRCQHPAAECHKEDAITERRTNETRKSRPVRCLQNRAAGYSGFYNWWEAKRFYGILIAATVIGTALNFTKLDPMKALIWSAAINGIVAVPDMVVMMHMAASSKVMGNLTRISKKLRALFRLVERARLAASLARR